MCAISALCGAEARQPGTVNVDSQGVVSTGASKLSEQNYDFNKSNYQTMKPTKKEITDFDTRKAKENNDSYFK